MCNVPRPIYIFDLDGTLTDTTHRQHFLAETPKRWSEFNAACVNDAPQKHMVELARRLWFASGRIWIWTGRDDLYETQTKAWLWRHGVRFEQLRMRPTGRHIEDTELKHNWLVEVQSTKDYANIACVFEDRTRMVEMYRRNGIPCMQVADGNF
jgi:FMN phosphatase YigB (HAD superfamily)